MSQEASTELTNSLIEVYGQLLLDPALVFAVILAWAVTHFIKQYPGIKKLRPIADRRFTIRVISAFVGFAAVLFLKREMLFEHTGDVINFAVMVAFVHPVLYKVMTAVLDKFAPNISKHLKS